MQLDVSIVEMSLNLCPVTTLLSAHVGADGGRDYLRRGFRYSKEDYEELSETVEISPE